MGKNLNHEVLKIRIKIHCEEKNYSDNGVDLFSHKVVKSLIRSSSEKLLIEDQIIEKDLDKIISFLEELGLILFDKKVISQKEYMLLERLMQKISESHGMNLSILDNAIWHYMRYRHR